MQIHITPRNITLTGAIHEFVAEKVSHLEGHGETILAAHIVLLHNHDRKKPYTVKVHLALSGPDIHAEDAEADLYVAIDNATVIVVIIAVAIISVPPDCRGRPAEYC
jgi:putative sigma-54 modulation protein